MVWSWLPGSQIIQLVTHQTFSADFQALDLC